MRHRTPRGTATRRGRPTSTLADHAEGSSANTELGERGSGEGVLPGTARSLLGTGADPWEGRGLPHLRRPFPPRTPFRTTCTLEIMKHIRDNDQNNDHVSVVYVQQFEQRESPATPGDHVAALLYNPLHCNSGTKFPHSPIARGRGNASLPFSFSR